MPRSSLASTMRTVVQPARIRSWESHEQLRIRQQARPWYPQLGARREASRECSATPLAPERSRSCSCIALLIFGPKKLPELGKGLGRGMRDFKRAVTGDDEDERKDEEEKTKAALPEKAPEPVATRQGRRADRGRGRGAADGARRVRRRRKPLGGNSRHAVPRPPGRARRGSHRRRAPRRAPQPAARYR